MRIDSAGNVGIGTASPESVLNVRQAQAAILVQDTNTGFATTQAYIKFSGSDANGDFRSDIEQVIGIKDNSFVFERVGVERMRIDSTGNVGIGTISPSEKLEVAGKVYIESQGVNWNEITPGLVRGALHLDPAGSAADNTGNAITFGASDRLGGTNAQAGIYTRSDGAYGTKMYFATTDDYSVGSKTGMMIDYNSNVGIGTTSPSADLHVQGSNSTDVPIIRSGGFGNSGSKLELAETLTGGNMTYGFSFFNDGNSSNKLIVSAHNNSTTGVAAFSIDRTNSLTAFNVNPQVGTRAAGDNTTHAASTAFVTNALTRVVPVTPTTITSTIVGETIEIAFNQSTTSNVDYYQVWSSDDGGDYGIIAQVAPTDFSSTMTVVDTTFITGGTMSYRVYAVREGIYSSPGTTSKTYTVPALSVTNMTVVNFNTAYYVQYEKPISRFIDHIEIYMDSQATSAALNRSNATIVYSGQNTSYMRNVNANNNFHQFWVEIVTT